MIVKLSLRVISDYLLNIHIKVEKWVKPRLGVGDFTSQTMQNYQNLMNNHRYYSVWGIQKGLTRPLTQANIVRPTQGHNCLGSNTMTASLVTPGMQVSTTAECEPGLGTVEVDGRILSTMVGRFTINDLSLIHI